jgi:hypothetical protein
MFASLSGIEPLKALAAICSICRFGRLNKQDGILPDIGILSPEVPKQLFKLGKTYEINNNNSNNSDNDIMI